MPPPHVHVRVLTPHLLLVEGFNDGLPFLIKQLTVFNSYSQLNILKRATSLNLISLVTLEAFGEHDVDEHDQFLRVANQLANLVM